MSQTRSTTILQPKQVFVGAKGAQVTLVEFGDYESTACAEANTVVKELLEHFDGELKFVFRHFPLSQIHQKAMKAAEAAVAAAQARAVEGHQARPAATRGGGGRRTRNDDRGRHDLGTAVG